MNLVKAFTGFANAVARVTGRPLTFALCLITVVVWAVSGPVFKFSDTWQLVINTGTTIVTFLMVFLIQNTQNRDNAALQAKLDELLNAVPKADPKFIGIEHLTDEELEAIVRECEARAGKAAKAKPSSVTHGRSFGEPAGTTAKRRAASKPKAKAA
jgi:low affinity Fe/Cu permease